MILPYVNISTSNHYSAKETPMPPLKMESGAFIWESFRKLYLW